MNKDQISTRIKEIETELSNLREELNKPDEIIDFEVGDVFGFQEGKGTRVLILNHTYSSRNYELGNCCDSALKIWSDFNGNGGSKPEILTKLNNNNAKFIKNINKELNDLVKN